MTTASNAILTNSIDTVTAGTLTIGGTNTTQVNINENVTVSGTLGATTVTATGGITTPEPITLSYTVLPTFTPNQIGYQYVRTLASDTLIPDTSSNTDVVVQFATPNAITFPVGVWNVSFGLSFISLTTASTSITTYQTYASFLSGVIIGTQRMPTRLGLTNVSIGGSPITLTNSPNTSFNINDSLTFQNDVPNNELTLIFRLIFTNAVGGNLYLQGLIGSPATPTNYLILTRLA
jgi:hypothetical protein